MKTFRTTRRMILLLTAVVLLAAPALRADPEPWPQTPAGTWVFSTLLPEPPYGPGGTLPGMVTYNADGTATYSDATMFGGFAAANHWKFGPYYGVWERTGHNRFGTTAIGLVFRPDTNVVIGFARGRSALRYDGSSSKLVGTLDFDFGPCSTESTCPDPTDPSLEWTSLGSFSVVLSRVTRVPASSESERRRLAAGSDESPSPYLT